jgi:hypothetical protein
MGFSGDGILERRGGDCLLEVMGWVGEVCGKGELPIRDAELLNGTMWEFEMAGQVLRLGFMREWIGWYGGVVG